MFLNTFGVHKTGGLITIVEAGSALCFPREMTHNYLDPLIITHRDSCTHRTVNTLTRWYLPPPLLLILLGASSDLEKTIRII